MTPLGSGFLNPWHWTMNATISFHSHQSCYIVECSVCLLSWSNDKALYVASKDCAISMLSSMGIFLQALEALLDSCGVAQTRVKGHEKLYELDDDSCAKQAWRFPSSNPDRGKLCSLLQTSLILDHLWLCCLPAFEQGLTYWNRSNNTAGL